MSEQILISEVYLSCVDQKINGRIYMSGEIVPDAGSLPTLAALMATNRMRLAPASSFAQVQPLSLEESSADLGTEEATPKRPRKASKRKRRAARS